MLMWDRLNTLRHSSLLQAPDISQFFIKREREREVVENAGGRERNGIQPV
jgi:hypothetical protein